VIAEGLLPDCQCGFRKTKGLAMGAGIDSDDVAPTEHGER